MPTVEQMNPWRPMTDPLELKVMGKLGEETNELGAVVNRCIIQGVEEKVPGEDKTNRVWLQEEMADVIAGIELTAEKWNLDWDFIHKRVMNKKMRLRTWHEMM